MILESIVTTMDLAGNVNLAPMGPTVKGDGSNDQITGFILRPFRSTRTYANLKQNGGKAVVHITDDSLLFAKAAVGAIDADLALSRTTPVDSTGCRRLIDCHRWFAVESIEFSEDDVRATIVCRIMNSGTTRPFFGFNRAKHAVIEAAILATRTHLIDPDEINRELERLSPLVDKTCGPQEREAFDFLIRTILDRIQGNVQVECNLRVNGDG